MINSRYDSASTTRRIRKEEKGGGISDDSVTRRGSKNMESVQYHHFTGKHGPRRRLRNKVRCLESSLQESKTRAIQLLLEFAMVSIRAAVTVKWTECTSRQSNHPKDCKSENPSEGNQGGGSRTEIAV